MFELPEAPSLIRRIGCGLIELAQASLRPLRYREVQFRILRDCVLGYVVMVLMLHFVGYRSWYPHFHRVRETLHDAAIHSVPLSFFLAVFSYFSMLRERDSL